MFWVYVLELSDGRYYIGQTNDISKRLYRHNSGQSKYTSKFLPATLLYQEEYVTRSEAVRREKYLKSLKSRQALREIIKLDGDGLIV